MDRYAELLAANTSAYGGYTLSTALEHIAALGYRRVEIAAMYGLVEHIAQAQFTAKHAAEVKSMMSQNGLQSTAFSAHLYLNRPDAVDLLLPRMDFAKGIGAAIINTKAGAPSGMDQFLRNMERLIRHAEDIELRIGLETHGDIVDYGSAAVETVRRFGTDLVLLNYDFGNVLVNSRGTVDPAADFRKIQDAVGQLHLKDAKKVDGIWEWTAIGHGTIDYSSILDGMRQRFTPLPMTVDLPLSLTQREGAPALPRSDLLRLAEIDRIMDDSLHFIRTGLGAAGLETEFCP